LFKQQSLRPGAPPAGLRNELRASALPLDHGQVASVALFHSVLGRKPAVVTAADRLRDAGHTMIAPDLYAGQVTETADEGFSLCHRIGWRVILGRARLSLAGMSPGTVLAGLSPAPAAPSACSSAACSRRSWAGAG
jgi:dienelactone hydrolase